VIYSELDRPMAANQNHKITDKTIAATAQHHQPDRRSSKLIKCPFEVRIDDAPHDQFYDLRDAMASARIAKRSNPMSIVVIADVRTGGED